MKRSRIVIIVVLVLVLLALLLARCGSSSSSPSDSQGSTASTQPTEELSLIGVECDSPGEVVEEAGASFVCAPAKKGGEKAAIYYGVATPADEQCATGGETRSANDIFSVCSNDKDAKKRKWLITVPMPVSITSFIDPGDSTEPSALEDVGVTIPEVIAALPGMQEFAVASTTTEPVTTIASTTSQSTTGETTVPESSTTAESTTTSSEATATTAAPETTAALNTTTAAPATTAAPNTTAAPATTVAPATSTTPVAQTCAQGGPCTTGDVGPGGGTVLVLTDESGNAIDIFEVAPVTWHAGRTKATEYVGRLDFGGQQDWRLPTMAEGELMTRSRSQFTCPGAKRCARGFANAYYQVVNTDNKVVALHFAARMVSEGETTAYIRPVRTIGAAG